jgi:hypothetical protein
MSPVPIPLHSGHGIPVQILPYSSSQGRGERTKGNVGRALSDTHIMYADDLIIFGQAKIGEVESLKRLMEEFGKVSGLRVNPT